ncbi:TetR/AcrR family transcriptional regulator [Nocardioides currus]|uniref:TetR family transcriptional regulator n=1 Tax=Nocardioides currus TaxID=2133958 RepID=A0A2R7YT06_9ACTN|nr:TetR/AcrR family transcriptional regulator [Nocardioides currus]PUA79394.1 TetR family transcriptional regulator [Nocardioides currus]
MALEDRQDEQGAAPEEEWAGRRADARRNHERVLAAAVEVFTELGLDATIPQVAARAGVGKATVYRSYPTKADLVTALARTHVDWLEGLVADAATRADEDAAAALRSLLHAIVQRLAEDRLMVEVLMRVEGGFEENEETTSQFEHVLEQGRRQGSLRADVELFDVQVLLAGFARSLIDLDNHDPATWRRFADFTLTALRP